MNAGRDVKCKCEYKSKDNASVRSVVLLVYFEYQNLNGFDSPVTVPGGVLVDYPHGYNF